jgi:hypothetical protein
MAPEERIDGHAGALSPSSSAEADDPVFRGVSDGIESSRRTGYPAFAGYDGGVLNAIIGRS